MHEAVPVIAVLFYLLMMCGVIAGWVILVLAAWRAMKAHESVSDSLRRIADKGDREDRRAGP